MSVAQPIVALILPAYNEAPVLGSVLAALPRHLPGIKQLHTFVVDDGSRDATSTIAVQHGAYALTHRINRGAGLARRTGLKAARRFGADIAVTLDADGQHDPTELPKLLAPIRSGQADMVVGSRLIFPEGMPITKQLINRLANLVVRMVWGVSSSDSQSGYRAYRLDRIADLNLRTTGYETDTEILIAAKHHNLRVVEVPIRAIYTAYSQTNHGQSLLNGITIVTRLLLRTILG